MILFVQVASEIALTNSRLVESNSETDLDDDIIDDAVEIKSLTPPEDLSYLWAPKVTEVCVEQKSPEDVVKPDTGREESIIEEEDTVKDGQHEDKDKHFPELTDEFAAEGLSDLVVKDRISKEKEDSEKELPVERIGKLASQNPQEDLDKGQKDVTKNVEETLVPNDILDKEADEKPKEDTNHVPIKKNRGNWTDVIFPEDSSKSLSKKFAPTDESRKGPVGKVCPKEIANSQNPKSRINWTDVVFKKDSNETSEAKMGASKKDVDMSKLQKSGLKETTVIRNSFEQKSKTNWTDVVFKKGSNTTKKISKAVQENEIQEKTGSKGGPSFQNTFEQSVLKAAKEPSLLSEALPKAIPREVNEKKLNSEVKEDGDRIEMAALTNGREDTEESEAEIEKRGVEEMDEMKRESTGTEEESEEANGSWKIDFIRVETEAKEAGKGKKALGNDETLSKPRREKLSKRKKERRKERRKENQAMAAAGGSLYSEDNGMKSARGPITVDTTLPTVSRKSQKSEKVGDKEVLRFFCRRTFSPYYIMTAVATLHSDLEGRKGFESDRLDGGGGIGRCLGQGGNNINDDEEMDEFGKSLWFQSQIPGGLCPCPHRQP